MHAQLYRISLAAFVSFVGLSASAQTDTIIEVNDGETLAEADLLAGSFMGQGFALKPGTLFKINEGGLLGPVGNSVEFRGSGLFSFDFGGSAIALQPGGSMFTDELGSGLTNVAFTALPGCSVLGSTLFGENSTVEFWGTSLGNLRFGLGSEAFIAGGTVEWLLVFDGAEAQVRGGRIANLSWTENADITVVGGEFSYAGVGLSAIPDDAEAGDVFTATLADGSVLIQRVHPIDPVVSLGLDGVPLPPATVDPIVAPVEEPPIGGLRPGQTLVLQDGARLPADYRAVGATIEVAGGVVEGGLVVSDLDMTFSGGVLAAPGVYPQALFYRSTLRIEGGELRPRVAARFGTTIEISGGETDTIDIDSGSVLVAGGLIELVEAYGDASIRITGGTVEFVQANDRVAVELSGGDTGFVSFRGESTLAIRGGTWPGGRDLAKLTTIESGSVGNGVRLPENGTLRITGGTIGDRFELQNNTSALITGGTIGSQFNLEGQSEAVVTGGAIGDRCTVLQGSRLVVSGGTIGDRFNLLSGTLELVVRSLRIDGVPVPITPGERIVIGDRGVALDGVLADGTPISFLLNADLGSTALDYFSPAATITAVGAIAAPCSAADLAEPFETLDLDDIARFVGAFLSQSPSADLNWDGFVELADITAFIDAFNAGCGL